MKAVVKAKAEPGLWLEEGVSVSQLSCIAGISPVWRDQQKAATLQESGGFCRFVRRSEHLTGNFYLLLTATCVAGLRTSSCALTCWICAACSFTIAARRSTVPSNSATLVCALRNSLSITCGAGRATLF